VSSSYGKNIKGLTFAILRKLLTSTGEFFGMRGFFDRFRDKILNVWSFLMKNMKSLSIFSLF
jgi:hypothetical protein